MIYSEHSQMINTLLKLKESLEYYHQDDPVWITDIDNTIKGWIQLKDHMDDNIGIEMVKNREWEISDAKGCLMRLYKSMKESGFLRNKELITYTWCMWIKTSLRKFENPKLLFYQELNPDIPISNCEIVGGREQQYEYMVYLLQDNIYYPIY